LNIQQYYSHSGRYTDKVWWNNKIIKNQQITMCSVKAYNKNSKFERKIWYLQEIRSSPLQAIKYCPGVTNGFHWPHAVQKATEKSDDITYPIN
jgi:hypothetical protein